MLWVLQLSVRTKLLGNKPSKPTLGFTISRDVEYKQVNALRFLHSKHALASKAAVFGGLLLSTMSEAYLMQVAPKKADKPSQPSVPAEKIMLNPTNDMTLDDKLKALDALHTKAFAEKGRIKEGGVEVATFTRK